MWRELEQGNEWVVDADLKDFFGSVDHDKLLALVNQRVSDGRVLGLIKQFLKAGCVAERKWLPTEQGTPQGGVISPLLSNILLTPFDREMRRKGYRLTRGSASCLPARQIHPPLQGPDPPAYATQGAREHTGADRGDQPGDPRLGPLLP